MQVITSAIKSTVTFKILPIFLCSLICFPMFFLRFFGARRRQYNLLPRRGWTMFFYVFLCFPMFSFVFLCFPMFSSVFPLFFFVFSERAAAYVFYVFSERAAAGPGLWDFPERSPAKLTQGTAPSPSRGARRPPAGAGAPPLRPARPPFAREKEKHS